MSNDNRKKNLTGGGGDDAAVEELLRAAHDDVLLNLRLNSHSVSSDSHFSSLDRDLMRRFDALKSKQPVPSSSNSDADELESRFAKLKGGVGSDQGISSVGSGGTGTDNSGKEDEVEKLMQWAMDAARLDQSSGKSTGEDEEDEIVSTESSDEDDEGDGKARGKKGKSKTQKKKWF